MQCRHRVRNIGGDARHQGAAASSDSLISIGRQRWRCRQRRDRVSAKSVQTSGTRFKTKIHAKMTTTVVNVYSFRVTV